MTAKVYGLSLGGDKNDPQLNVMVAQLCELTKNY